MNHRKRMLATVMAMLTAGSVVAFTSGVAIAEAPGWSLASTVTVGTAQNTLRSVTCPSPTDCVAVGNYEHDEDGRISYRTLIESWDGSDWSVVDSPNVGDPLNDLNAVSCASESSCVAVGRYEIGRTYGTLIETWDGSNWTATAGPNDGDTFRTLLGVSCASATSCVAAGEYDVDNSQVTLLDTWDGESWTVTPTPNLGTTLNTLDSVSCASTSSCVAVGFYADEQSPNHTLVLTWDGLEWSTNPSPDADNGSALLGVSCVDSSTCTAVGFSDSDTGEQALVETFDGVSWSVTPSPQVGSGVAQLSSVACIDSDTCIAVGMSAIDSTLVETWDGASWSVAPSANPGSRYNFLLGVGCADADSCAAVGYFQNLDAAAANRSRAGVPAAQAKRTLGEIGPAVPRLRSPGAPIRVVASAGNRSATITWSPAVAHGSKIMSYTVRASRGSVSVTVGAHRTRVTLRGLKSGVKYRFTVTATNAVGPSASSRPSKATTPS
jgi:hypothetical protein